MGFWKSAAGFCLVELTSAAPADMLTAINRRGITVFDITYTDDLCVKAHIYRHDIKTLRAFLNQRGDRLKVLGNKGIYWTAKALLKRPVLLMGVLFFCVLALYLPTRVLFIHVEGNCKIPSQLIIERAEMCGIGFGASRREVRSERIKNALLSAIPELQWAGVNTAGCVAVISVQERSDASIDSAAYGVSSIVASHDGIIQQITVLRGSALCKVGQAVQKGQVLVSGYTDCGISIKAERAKAEIAALTFRDLEVISLSESKKRRVITKEESRYSLRIGKNIINFFKGSGISDTTCVKMYEEKFLTLPGGFRLPVALITERLICYEYESVCADETEEFAWLDELAQIYLQQQMLAGRILQSSVVTKLQDGIIQQYGRYTCTEMIGQVRSEEKIDGNGKGN